MPSVNVGDLAPQRYGTASRALHDLDGASKLRRSLGRSLQRFGVFPVASEPNLGAGYAAGR
eukprot:5944326-Pyramimonas_sp.AAC.1